MPEIDKSSRHSAIVGKYGEYLVCNWLSRSGYEVVLVDHTGIDVIAFNPKSNLRMGITVKSRTRDTKEGDGEPVHLLSKKKKSREKLKDACRYFKCKPWIAIFVETSKRADLYLTSLKNYDKKYGNKNNEIDSWKMTKKDKLRYSKDAEVKHIEIKYTSDHWR